MTCRPSAGNCDIAESCTGSSADCPIDIFSGSSTICSTAVGLCSVDAHCTGSSANCPNQVYLPEDQPCSDNNPCTTGDKCKQGKCVGLVQTCSQGFCEEDTTKPTKGTCQCADPAYTYPSCNPVCGNGIIEGSEKCDPPGDCCSSSCQLQPTSFVCRSSRGSCDVSEKCDGITPYCPADSVQVMGTACRPKNASLPCDVAEACNGQSPNCPAGTFILSLHPVSSLASM